MAEEAVGRRTVARLRIDNLISSNLHFNSEQRLLPMHDFSDVGKCCTLRCERGEIVAGRRATAKCGKTRRQWFVSFEALFISDAGTQLIKIANREECDSGFSVDKKAKYACFLSMSGHVFNPSNGQTNALILTFALTVDIWSYGAMDRLC